MSARRKTIQWTKEDDDFIRKNYDSMTDAELGRALGQKSHNVRTRRLKLGLKKDKHLWTIEEDGYIARYYHIKDVKTLSRELGRSVQSIRNRAYSLKVTNTQDIRNLNNTKAERVYKQLMKKEEYRQIRDMIEHKKKVFKHDIEKSKVYKLKSNTHHKQEIDRYGQKAEKMVKVLEIHNYVILVEDIKNKLKECVSKVDLYTKEKTMEEI